MEPHVAEGQRLIMSMILPGGYSGNSRVRCYGTAKGAEKEEANLLGMAPLCALYVRHVINHSARPLLCFHLLGRNVTSC